MLENYPTLRPKALPAIFAYAAQAVRRLPPLSEPDPD